MKIEILFPEFANLYGEMSSVQYLKQCLPEAEFVETHLNTEPVFAKEDVAMIFMASMTEHQQELVIEKLQNYKERIKELIEKNVVFLMVGNAMEVFGEYIEEDGTKIPALGLFPVYAKRQMMNRYHCMVMGEMEGMKIVGFKAQFSHSYGSNEDCYMYRVLRGAGLNPDSKFEGIRKKNFMGTYTLGPILLLNPDFTKYILTCLGIEHPVLPYEETIEKAYKLRLAEFEKPEIVYQ